MMTITTLAALEALRGTTLHSQWRTITQEMIDAFADASGDHQWIHVDPERARAESPFGTTIAHGFFTLSLLTALLQQCIQVRVKAGINYGLDRVRFVHPVRCGDRIRGSFTLETIDVNGAQADLAWNVAVEIEGASKPALVATWRSRLYFDEAPATEA